MVELIIPFDRQSKYTVRLAVDAAAELNRAVVGAEHLLLGLLHLGQGEGKDFNLCAYIDQSYCGVHDALRESIKRADRILFSYSPEQRYALAVEHSMVRAVSLGKPEVSPEDLLWGLVAAPDSYCPAYRTLEHLGVTRQTLRKKEQEKRRRSLS